MSISRKCLLIIILFSCTDLIAFTDTIPFRWWGKLMMVEAKVKGINGYFILDTGTQYTILNQKYYEGFRKKVSINGVNGSLCGTVTAADIELGSMKISSQEALITDISRIENIRGTKIHGFLGRSVLRQLHMEIDFKEREIRLSGKKGFTKVKGKFYPPGISDIKIQFKGVVPTLSVTIGGKPMKMLIDTGSEYCAFTKGSFRKIKSFWHQIDEKIIVGHGNTSEKIEIGKFSEHSFGRKGIQSPKYYVLPNMTSLGVISINGLIGMDFLKQFQRIVFDFALGNIEFTLSKDQEESLRLLAKKQPEVTEMQHTLKFKL